MWAQAQRMHRGAAQGRARRAPGATCNKRDERLRERPELVADRAAHGGRVGRQARRQCATRVFRHVEEGDLLRRGAAGSPVLVGYCFEVGLG